MKFLKFVIEAIRILAFLSLFAGLMYFIIYIFIPYIEEANHNYAKNKYEIHEKIRFNKPLTKEEYYFAEQNGLLGK